MFCIVVYLLFAYTVIALVWNKIKQRIKRERTKPIVRIALLLLPCLPYVVVSAQTALYGTAMLADTKQAMLDTGYMDSKVVRLRVMFISPQLARVLVEEPCSEGTIGTLLDLRRNHGHWKLVEGDTVWSDAGSAEGNTFPPYPEAKEG